MNNSTANNTKTSNCNADSDGLLPVFQQHQLAFTATIRSPEQNPTPDGIEERRMNIYRELVYNNIEDLLANFFPVLKLITPHSRWHEIVGSFIASHKSKTPIFMKLAEEFVIYLQTGFCPQSDDPVFLVELAHYEWVEISLSVATGEPDWDRINRHDDFTSGAPYLSPFTWPLHYQYPVHRIGPNNLPTRPATTHLLVYRDTTDEVRFMEINAVTARLLQAIKINAQSETKANGVQLLQKVATDLQHPNPDAVISGGLQTMHEWFKRDVLLGTYK
jgi:hypothetical protein